jgi:PiT family inorganic phosphate transporter
VAKTIASGLVDTNVVTVTSQRAAVRAAGGDRLEPDHLVVGLAVQSSHALIGGLCGAALAARRQH